MINLPGLPRTETGSQEVGFSVKKQKQTKKIDKFRPIGANWSCYYHFDPLVDPVTGDDHSLRYLSLLVGRNSLKVISC